MAKRILALVLALSLVFAFAACKKDAKDDETTTLADGETVAEEVVTDEEGEVVTDAEAEAEETETNAEGEVVTDAEAEETVTDAAGKPAAKPEANKPGTKPEANKPAANKVPSTPAEVVAAFNSAANAVKADKPGYTKTEHNDVNADKLESSSKLITKLAKQIVPMFPTEGPSATVAKGQSHNAFPVQGGKTALTVGMVKSATAKAAGNGSYTITIKMKDEKLAQLPTNPAATNHGKAFNVLSKAEVDAQLESFKAIAKVNKFQPTYSGSYITATINANGKMTKAFYRFETHAILDVKALGASLQVYVPFAVEQNYTIKY